jgi:hypothetical protein
VGRVKSEGYDWPLHCKTLFGESRKRLPVIASTVVSASNNFNKIIFLDKTVRIKYSFARDDFIARTQKPEKQRREDRYESMRY